MDIIKTTKVLEYCLSVRTSTLINILVDIFKKGDTTNRKKINNWLSSNSRDGFVQRFGDNFVLSYLDQRDGRNTQHYWRIDFNEIHSKVISKYIDISENWQGMVFNSRVELKLAKLLYEYKIPFLSNTRGVVLPQENTLSNNLLSGRVEYDFLLLNPVIKIEIDGDHHLENQQHQLDIASDRVLQSLGISTLRFTAKEVWEQPELVIAEIKNYLFGKN